MSELRERVAAAIYAAVNDEEHWAWEAAWLRADYLAMADAAMEAMQAEPTATITHMPGMISPPGDDFDTDDTEPTEPTEAEIAVVARVAMGCPYTPPCPSCMDRAREGLRAARTAAP
jgi:hypothetical protein